MILIDSILFMIAGAVILYLSIDDLLSKFKDKTANGKAFLITIPFIGLILLIIGFIKYLNI